jgi:hypothetical protein
MVRRCVEQLLQPLLATLLLAPAAPAQATVFRFQFQLTGLDAPAGARGER